MSRIILIVLVPRADLDVSNEVLEARVRERLGGLASEWEVDKVAVLDDMTFPKARSGS